MPDKKLSVEEINALVNQGDYVPDKEQYGVIEDWRGHAEEELLKRGLRGDCDDFAIAKAQLLLKHGYDPEKIRLVTAVTPQGEGHMVTAYDDGNDTKILDLHANPYSASKAQYRFISSMRASAPGAWKKFTNG